MGKKKKGGKKGASGGGKSVSENAVIEFPPPKDRMQLLYRKASFDVLPEKKENPIGNLLTYQQDRYHRAVVPGYCQFLKDRKFWMSGDPVPDDAIPKPPAAPKQGKGDGKKKKK